MSDGRVLWLFGDSHIDDYDPETGTTPCLFQARNAGLLHSKDDLSNAITMVDQRANAGRTWFKTTSEASERWFWPGCGFHSGNTVYVYLSALRNTGTGGMWGFASVGTDWWAKIKFPEMDSITYSELPSFNGICFAQGFVTDGEFTFAFGGKQRGIGSDVFVARLPSANPESAWQFWNGRAWTTNVGGAAPVTQGKSTSVHVCKVRNKFLLTTSSFSIACDQGHEIFMATAPRPTGPFSPLKKIYTLDDTYHGHYPFFYIPAAHPEFINASSELLVTYSINGYEPCVSSCFANRAIPDHYRPKAIRVPLKLIDPEL